MSEINSKHLTDKADKLSMLQYGDLDGDDPKSWEDMLEGATLATGSSDDKRVTKWDIKKTNTRRMIMRAGRDVFADRGFQSPKVEDVAKAAGISRAAFYLHFKSLEQLMESIFKLEVRWQLRRYNSLDWDILQSRRKIGGWLERFYASFRQERQYILIIYRTLAMDPRCLRHIHDENHQMIMRLANRISELDLVDANGESDQARTAQMHNICRRLEELSLYTAFDSWTNGAKIAADQIADALYRFANGPDAT